MTRPTNGPLVLLIRDGWGENPNPEHEAFNAVHLASKPIDERLRANWPWTLIATSGEDVGLLEGTMGNSEVGHQNIGAGRIVDQDTVRITKACRTGTLRENKPMVEAIRGATERGKTVHLMGINSDAGVHGLLDHLYAIVELCRDLGHEKVVVHLFTDGRDTGPHTGKEYAAQVQARLAEIGVGRIGSVIGRYWAMDRDNRWERVKTAYDCLTGRAEPLRIAPDPVEAISAFYKIDNGSMSGDEFVPPTVIAKNATDAKETRVRDGDAVIFYNYRGDRPREIISAFIDPDFPENAKPSPDTGAFGFSRGPMLDLDFVMMTPYSTALAKLARVAFLKPPRMDMIAGSYFESLGCTQFRCAETEKYPHVTFFFNDYRDEPYPGEQRELIQSPRVATYDKQPEMSAAGITEAVLARLNAPDCEDFIVVNFANGDMVGHTGNLDATIKACETVDSCVGQIIEATLARGGQLLVTADHGNAEQMWNPETKSPHTAHTTYPVPVIVIGAGLENRRLREGGRLADLVPTLLEMGSLPQPPEMTGRSLLA